MFDLGWSKVLILAVVAIVVVGPKELPALLRAVGQFIAQLRRHAAEFRAQFDEAMKSTELDQIRRDVEAIKTDATASLRGIERSIEQDANDARTAVEKSVEGTDGFTLAGQGSPAEPIAGRQTDPQTGPQTDPKTDSTHAKANGAEPHPAPAPEPVSMPEPAGYALPAMPVAPLVAEPAAAPSPAAPSPLPMPAKTGT